ncbi:hypothetical protein [Sphingomonas turrisvirgatae]|uniref:hypothetical protein n=1 Tax=Sphingomonas turrisvirgatae TaxID=1888892 RepID=UPI001301040B|nr:hypothetical protein [Sphingomonas turrisvirgatae]
MPLSNGLYEIAFETKTGTDYGVVYMHDGKIRGGDGSTAFVGKARVDGMLFSAEMSVTQHRHLPGTCPGWGSAT